MKRRAFLGGLVALPLAEHVLIGHTQVKTPLSTPAAAGPPSDCFRFMEAAERKAGRSPIRYEVGEKLWNDLWEELRGGPRNEENNWGVQRLFWKSAPVQPFDSSAEVPPNATYALVLSTQRVLPPCGPPPNAPRHAQPYDLRWKWPR